jgi:hypothetical protein
MPLSTAQKAIADGLYVATPQPMVLFHGTTDSVFFSRVCGRYGFQSDTMFMGYYSLRPLGPTTVYGPGIYMADTRAEAATYGHLIVRFEFDATTRYADIRGGPPGNAFRVAVGANQQNVLDEGGLHALLRVTANYYVLRTPYNVLVGPDPNPSPIGPIWT